MTGFSLHVGLNDYAPVRAAGVPGFIPNLLGAVADATHWREFAGSALGIEETHSALLVTASDVRKAGVLQLLDEYVRRLRDGDHLLVTWSGHGVQAPTADTSTTEPDGLDECLVTSDFTWEEPLRDDDLAAIVSAVPPAALCTLIVDVCHSATITRAIAEPGREVLHGIERGRGVVAPDDVAATVQRLVAESWPMPARSVIGAENDRANVALLAACGADELAKETYFRGEFRGSFSAAMLETLAFTSPRSTLATVLLDTTVRLRTLGATQTPRLETTETARQRPLWP